MKDVIIILGGGLNEDGSLPPIPTQRMDYGIALFKQGVARNIIISGKHGFLVNYKHKKTEAKAMAQYALGKGVRKESILFEEESLDTIGNAYFTKIRFLIPNN